MPPANSKLQYAVRTEHFGRGRRFGSCASSATYTSAPGTAEIPGGLALPCGQDAHVCASLASKSTCASRTSVSARRDCGRTWTTPTVTSTAAVRPETWSETKPQLRRFGYSDNDRGVTSKSACACSGMSQGATCVRDSHPAASVDGHDRHRRRHVRVPMPPAATLGKARRVVQPPRSDQIG